MIATPGDHILQTEAIHLFAEQLTWHYQSSKSPPVCSFLKYTIYKFLYVPFIHHFIYFLHLGCPPTPLAELTNHIPARGSGSQSKASVRAGRQPVVRSVVRGHRGRGQQQQCL